MRILSGFILITPPILAKLHYFLKLVFLFRNIFEISVLDKFKLFNIKMVDRTEL